MKTVALTNTWKPQPDELKDPELKGLFDVWIESAEEGTRKPEAAMYSLVEERVGDVLPQE